MFTTARCLKCCWMPILPRVMRFMRTVRIARVKELPVYAGRGSQTPDHLQGEAWEALEPSSDCPEPFLFEGSMPCCARIWGDKECPLYELSWSQPFPCLDWLEQSLLQRQEVDLFEARCRGNIGGIVLR